MDSWLRLGMGGDVFEFGVRGGYSLGRMAHKDKVLNGGGGGLFLELGPWAYSEKYHTGVGFFLNLDMRKYVHGPAATTALAGFNVMFGK